MRPSTILVIEDNPITRKMLRLALESDGHEVLEAGDGITALDRASVRRPDLVVLDYVLPDTDGADLLGVLRRRTGRPDLPAIIVTGMPSRARNLRGQDWTNVQFLPKPLTPAHLIEVARGYLDPLDGNGSEQGRRVLVASDDHFGSMFTELRLRQAGYHVQSVAGPSEALDRATADPPQAILADVLMSSMDGFTFCSLARRDPKLAHVPVVLMSPIPVGEQDRSMARSMGASALVERRDGLRHAIGALSHALASAAPPPVAAVTESLAPAHLDRVKSLLHGMTSQHVMRSYQTAIQGSTLAIMRGMSEILAEPRDVLHVIGNVLTQSLDAAGLSTGLLYQFRSNGALQLGTHFGIPIASRSDAGACFGHPELLSRAIAARSPATFSASVDGDSASRDFMDRLGLATAIVVPLIVDGAGFGAAVLASDAHDLTDPAWVHFARTLGAEFTRTVALGQSMTRLRQLAENIHEVFWLTDAKFTEVLYTSLAFEQVFGIDAEAVRRDPARWLDLVHPEDRVWLRHFFSGVQTGEIDVTYRIIRQDGSHRWIRTRGFPIRDAAGEVYRCAGASEDITSQKRAEEERDRRASQLRLLADAALRIGAADSVAGVAQVVTNSSRAILGAGAAETRAYIVGEGQPISVSSLAARFANGQNGDPFPPGLERRIRAGHGPVRLTRAQLPAEHGEGDGLQGWIGVPLAGRAGRSLGFIQLVDKYDGEFTEDDEAMLVQLAQLASEAIERAHLLHEVSTSRERLEMLSRRLVNLQEEERRAIARELHDEVGQILTGLRLMIETSIRQERPVEPAQIRDVAGMLLEKVKDLSLNLRPPMLDDLGLVPTLLWHFERYRIQTGVVVWFHHREVGRRMPPDIEITTFRVVQEALTNIARYANVTDASVEIWIDGDVLHLRIEDRGRGFDPASVPRNSTGLAGLRERVLLAGGVLDVDSHPGGGTRLVARLPITHAATGGGG